MRSTLLCLLALGGACTDSGSNEDGAAGTCLPTNYQSGSLRIAGIQPELDLQPGATRQLDVSVFVGQGIGTEPLDSCNVTWSVDGSGASVDDDGTLSIDASSPSGSKRKVTAHVEDLSFAATIEDPAHQGATIDDVSIDVWTYTPDAMPQLGTWHEATRTGCADLTESEPTDAEKINELVIFASGLTWVTWQPFETYIDYWATATVARPAITLTGAAGNYVPADMDLDGDFTVENGDLLLTNMFLGSKHPGGAPASICGHRFAKN